MSAVFGGGMKPYNFKRLYEDPLLNFISGFFSPPRYFIESLVISDFKILPEQTGFTTTTLMGDLPFNNSFVYTGVGMLDKSLTVQSSYGWFWAWPIMLAVGITIRLYAYMSLHALRDELFLRCVNKRVAVVLVVLVGMQIISVYLILAER